MATVEKERPEDPQLTGIVGQAEEGRAPDTCAPVPVEAAGGAAE